MYGCLSLAAAPLFRLLYGPQWDMAVPLFRVLVLGEMAFQFLPLVEAVMLVRGRVDQLAKAEALVQAGRMLLIAGAALHSLEAVCIAEAFHYVVFVLVFAPRLFSLVDVTLVELIQAHARSAALTICSLAAPFTLVLAFRAAGEQPNWVVLAAIASTTAVGWFIGVFVLGHQLRQEVLRTVTWLRMMLLRREPATRI